MFFKLSQFSIFIRFLEEIKKKKVIYSCRIVAGYLGYRVMFKRLLVGRGDRCDVSVISDEIQTDGNDILTTR